MEESKAHKVIKWIVLSLAIAVNLFIIVNACIPGAQSSRESNWIVEPVANIINSIKEDTINASNYDSFSSFIRKFVGHFSLFGLSGILTSLSFKFFYYNKRYKVVFLSIFSALVGILLAFLSELIQLVVPGRSGELLDVAIDLAGYFIGELIIILIVSILRLRTSKINNSDIDDEGELDMPNKKPAKPAKKEEKKPVKKAAPAKKAEPKKAAPAKKPAKPAKKKEEKKPVKKAEPKKAAPAKKPAVKKEEKKDVNYRNYHVVKRADGKWEVKYAGGEKAIKLFNTQAEATAYTKQMAKNQGGVMLVHNSKGASKGRIKKK